VLAENISPLEVEQVLAQAPAVLESVVVGTPHAMWGEEVFAWVVLNRGYEPSPATEESLRTHAANYLADYKVSELLGGAVVYLFRIRCERMD
jgi:acyl-coenzyme A synthetase/AMP-(fatty) acid ligase